MSNRLYFIVNGIESDQIFGNNMILPYPINPDESKFFEWFKKYTNHDELAKKEYSDDIDYDEEDYATEEYWRFKVSVNLEEKEKCIEELFNSIFDDYIKFEEELLKERGTNVSDLSKHSQEIDLNSRFRGMQYADSLSNSYLFLIVHIRLLLNRLSKLESLKIKMG